MKIINTIALICSLSLCVQCTESNKKEIKKYYFNEDPENACYCEMLNNKRNGWCITYYPTGHLKDSTYYKDDLAHGRSISFYLNGKIEKIGFYKNGKGIGQFSEYDSTTGRLTWEGIYTEVGDSIVLNGHKKYDKMGNIIWDETFYITIKLNKDTFKLGEEGIIYAKKYGNSKRNLGDNYMLKLVFGDFDSKFTRKNKELMYSFATVKHIDSIEGIFKTTKKGVNILRGCVSEDSTFTKGVPFPTISIVNYFEKTYYVK